MIYLLLIVLLVAHNSPIINVPGLYAIAPCTAFWYWRHLSKPRVQKNTLVIAISVIAFYLWVNHSILTPSRCIEVIVYAFFILLLAGPNFLTDHRLKQLLLLVKISLAISVLSFCLFKYFDIGLDFGVINSAAGNYTLINKGLFVYRLDPFNGALRFHAWFLEPNHFCLFVTFFFYLFLKLDDFFGAAICLYGTFESLSLFGITISLIVLFIELLTRLNTLRGVATLTIVATVISWLIVIFWDFLFRSVFSRLIDYDVLQYGLAKSNRFETGLLNRYNNFNINDLWLGRGYLEYGEFVKGYNSGYLEFLYIHGYFGLFLAFVVYASIQHGRQNLMLWGILLAIFLSNGYINWISILALSIITIKTLDVKENMLGAE